MVCLHDTSISFVGMQKVRTKSQLPFFPFISIFLYEYACMCGIQYWHLVYCVTQLEKSNKYTLKIIFYLLQKVDVFYVKSLSFQDDVLQQIKCDYILNYY